MVYSRPHFLETRITLVLVFGLFLTKYTFDYTKKTTNMAPTKSIKVFIVVIIFIVIKARNSTADSKYN